MDNAPAHPELSLLRSDEGNITCEFLPKNTTSLIQPMDQAVIETFKRRYRKKFIRNLVLEEDVSLLDYWKNYNLKDVVENASDAWADVSQETLKRAWNKLWPESEQSTTVYEPNDDDAVAVDVVNEARELFSLTKEESNEWLNCDENENCYQLLSDDEIVQIASDSDSDRDSDFDGGDAIEEIAAQKNSREEARQAASNIQEFIDWYMCQENANHLDSLLLRRMKNFALLKSHTEVKQTKLTDFFNKNVENE